MNHSTHAKRGAGALAIAGLAGLFAIAPASASEHDTGGLTPADVRVYEAGGDIGVTAPVTSPFVSVPIDDNALEFVQIGLGFLAGMAVVAGGVTAANSVRHHGQAHPA